MMLYKQFLLAALLSAPIVSPSLSQAAVVTATYKGFTSDYEGSQRDFGDFSGSRDFTATFRYDTAKGNPRFTSGYGASAVQIEALGETATLEINGVTLSIGGSDATGVNTRSQSNENTSSADDRLRWNQSVLVGYAYLDGLSIPASIDTPFTADFSNPINTGGSFENDATGFYVMLYATSLNVSVEGPTISPVPLPASAPMFGAALLSLAGIAYGRKRRTPHGNTVEPA